MAKWPHPAHRGFVFGVLGFCFLHYVCFSPKLTRDWWLTTWKDTPEAYQAFIDGHEDDAPDGIKNLKIEKDHYYKAVKSNELSELREDQKWYADDGQFQGQVLEKLKPWNGKR
ncbi:MAG: hypothetical protein IPO07_05075 [Haliscomenobacter sp.]|nr:hypothetical protein [Haliscomenobacter sp.]MBK9488224.1 hypothetical protein [Haliscomenobacter sp.]